MLNRFLTLAASSLTLALGAIAPALAAPQDYVGTWVNKNPNTRSVTHFVVRSTGANTLSVQVFGKCHPTDCNWGTVPLVTYGLNVNDTRDTNATATYPKSFAQSLLTLDWTGKSALMQEFTQFTDNSGRQNYYVREYFNHVN